MRDGTHPDPLTIVRKVCEPGAGVDPSLRRHLEQCSSCAGEVRHLESVRAALPEGERGGELGPQCLDDDLLAATVAGDLEAMSRSDVIVHLASCAHCRRAVASLARVLDDPEVANAKVAAGRDLGHRRRLFRLAVPAAAAAVLLIAVFGRQEDEARPSAIHRAPATATAQEPIAISPRGAGDRPAWLRWRAVTGADRYRVTLFQPDGRTLYQLQLRDTAAALPESIALLPGRSYLWKVEARTDWDRWASSPLVGFSIGGPVNTSSPR